MSGRAERRPEGRRPEGRRPKGRRAGNALDRLRLEVFHHLFAAAAEEMGVSLMRSAFSPNIKERRDFSCALFDRQGRMIGQAAHLPVHLGAAPLSVAAAIRAVPMRPGDAVLLNDPFQGGTHLPDLTLVSPIFLEGGVLEGSSSEGSSSEGSISEGSISEGRAFEGRAFEGRALEGDAEPDFYCANRAHHADVGGARPGSMAPAADVHGEGLRIPPTHVVRGGEIEREVVDLLLANMRVPREREGDLLAQWAANRVGERRLREMAAEHGVAEVRRRAEQLMDWTEELTAEVLRGLPAGEWRFEDTLEIDGAPGGAGSLRRIRLRLAKRGERLSFDFTETDDELVAPVNTTRAVVVAAVFYVMRLLLPPGTPTNDGVLRRVEIATRPGSLVDARYPMPVAAGNVETSQRLVDVLLGALAQVFPERMPAASAGTMSNLTFGGRDSAGEAFAYYETIAGGAGGGPAGAGAHALQTHMTNTRNTPIEALENALPVRVLAYTVRRGSGGAGRGPGGDGVRKRLTFRAPVSAAWVAERQRTGPWGLAGGAPGAPGGARARLAPGGPWRRLGGKVTLELPAGGELELSTPGGGGHGRAR